MDKRNRYGVGNKIKKGKEEVCILNLDKEIIFGQGVKCK